MSGYDLNTLRFSSPRKIKRKERYAHLSKARERKEHYRPTDKLCESKPDSAEWEIIARSFSVIMVSGNFFRLVQIFKLLPSLNN